VKPYRQNTICFGMGVVPGDSEEVCRSSFTRDFLTLFLAHPKTCVDSVTGLARHVGDQEAPLNIQAVLGQEITDSGSSVQAPPRNTSRMGNSATAAAHTKNHRS